MSRTFLGIALLLPMLSFAQTLPFASPIVDMGAAQQLRIPTYASVGALPASGCIPESYASVTGTGMYRNSGTGTCVWAQVAVANVTAGPIGGLSVTPVTGGVVIDTTSFICITTGACAPTNVFDLSGATKTLPFQNASSAPGSPVESQVYYNLTTHHASIYNGSAYVGLGGSSTWGTIGSGSDNSHTFHMASGSTLDHVGGGIIDAPAVGGVTITGTPSSGYVPIASSSSAAAWGPATGGAPTAGNNTTVSGTAVSWVPFDPTTSWIKDEFCGGTNASSGDNLWGELGWLTRSDNTGGIVTYGASVANHPCMIHMTTDASTAFGNEMLSLVSISTVNQIPPLNTGSYEFNFVFRMNQTGTSDLYVGLNGEAFGSEFSDVNDAYLRYNTGDNANWQFRICVASSCTTTNTGNAADTAWHRLRIQSVSGTATICMDACSSPTAITSMPSTTLMPMFYIGNLSSAVSRSVDVDMFSAMFTGLTRF